VFTAVTAIAACNTAIKTAISQASRGDGAGAAILFESSI
jgi:hypothetical protein